MVLGKAYKVIFWVMLSTVLTQLVWAAGYSFRYRDDNGAIHIGYSVPPEFVANGYDVLNDRGRVVDTILPKEVLDAKSAKLLEEAETRHQYELQRSKDEVLLRFYSSPEDVERVRERRLQEFDNFIAIQQANIKSYRARIVKLQSQAANLERSGRKVPKDIMATLSTLEENIIEANETIEIRREEIKKIELAFAQDIKRLKFLLGQN